MIDPSALVLVAVMNSPQDLEIARLLGWYRIPLRRAPKVIAVDYLAFYQTGAFPSEKWQIKYLAPVTGYELTTRAELLQAEANHPRASHEYYKIQLGGLTTLPSPILATNWKRITFFYTLGMNINVGETIDDLIVDQEERRALWCSLRERAGQYERGASEQSDSLDDLSPEVIEALLGLAALSKK